METRLRIRCLVKPSEYHDSVTLMSVAQEVSRLPEVEDVAVVMATEANKGILKEAGLLTAEAEAASSNDLVVALRATESAMEQALAEVDRLLHKKELPTQIREMRPKTLRSALKQAPQANVAVVSVAGRYAADEAWEALHHGLHVLLFSDNVSLQDEIAIKKFADAQHLLLMGPGAGTALINGVALGFANVVPSGLVGIVSAAGTGLQEVSTQLARRGVGITQGIGTGGRDLSEQVGGIMMLAGLQALQADPATEVIVLISKPPAATVALKVLDQVALGEKPAVVCFLGGKFERLPPGVWAASTLEEAAVQAAALTRPGSVIEQAQEQAITAPASELRSRLSQGQRYLRGLYSGGTLCYEAQVIWRDLLPEPVYSNAPLDERNRLSNSTTSVRHSAVDLGEEEFTVGRLHPMIDNDLRIRRLHQEARDPETAVIVLDVVLGYGAHPDPAGELASAVRQAREQAVANGRELIVVASATGTEHDPQSLSRQERLLAEAGVIVCPSNAAAARLVAGIVRM